VDSQGKLQEELKSHNYSKVEKESYMTIEINKLKEEVIYQLFNKKIKRLILRLLPITTYSRST